MGIIVIIILAVLLIVIESVCTGYLTKAAADMTVGEDEHQNTAHRYLTAAATFGWIAIVLIIAGAIAVAVFGGPELAESSVQGAPFAKWIVLGFLGLTIVVFIINGVLAVVAAVELRKGIDFDTNKSSYNICVGVGVASIGGVGLVIIFYIWKAISKRQAVKRAQARRIQQQRDLIEASLRLRQLRA